MPEHRPDEVRDLAAEGRRALTAAKVESKMASAGARSALTPHPIGKSSALLALLASALWGGNVAALKLGLTAFPPFWSAWWRMLLGVAVVALWASSQRVRLRAGAAERRPLFVLAVLFAAQIILLNLGANLTSPAYAVVILNSHPIFSNLVGHYVSSERPLSRWRVFGLALAFGGICYLSLGRPIATLAPRPLLGNMLLITSALLLGTRTVYTRWLVQSIDPVRTVVWQMLFGLPFFLAPALLLEPLLLKPPGAGPVLALLYQGLIVASLCFIIWTALLRRHTAGTLSMFAFTVPFFGVLASWVLFSEPVTARILLAAGLVTAGIAIVTRAPGAAETPDG